jgi:hypothetical protein
MKRYKYFTLMKFFPDPGYANSLHENALNELIQKEGWRPVRETPMGGSPFAGPSTNGIGYIFASLVLLEKDLPDR